MKNPSRVIPEIAYRVFGNIEKKYSSWNNSKFAILQAPFDLTTTYRHGTNLGPKAIIDASTNLELYDEELNSEAYLAGIHTEKLPPKSVDSIDSESTILDVQQRAKRVLRENKFPILLGGEHTITLGLFRVLKELYPDLSILYLDAHADLKYSYGDNLYSHACVARRLIEEGSFILQLGVRSISREEIDFLPNDNVKIIYQYATKRDSASLTQILTSLTKHVYISIDLDVFDPSIMPSVGTPEPGGMGWYDATAILKEVVGLRKVVGFDVVELAPIEDNIGPDFLAAKLVYKLIGYIVAQQT